MDRMRKKKQEKQSENFPFQMRMEFLQLNLRICEGLLVPRACFFIHYVYTKILCICVSMCVVIHVYG